MLTRQSRSGSAGCSIGIGRMMIRARCINGIIIDPITERSPKQGKRPETLCNLGFSVEPLNQTPFRMAGLPNACPSRIRALRSAREAEWSRQTHGQANYCNIALRFPRIEFLRTSSTPLVDSSSYLVRLVIAFSFFRYCGSTVCLNLDFTSPPASIENYQDLEVRTWPLEVPCGGPWARRRE